MKNVISFFGTLALLLLCSGCQKSTDLDYGDYADWTITTSSAKEYIARSVTPQSDGYFSCTKDTSMQVFFTTVPPALGKYRIVSETKATNHTLGAGEVAVEFNVGLQDVYLSLDGNDSANVVVTDKGFRHLYVPSIRVIHVYNGSSFDTATALGNISFPDH